MNLISETEQARIVEEARRLPCEGTRMNDPHWALGIMLSVLGLIMVLSSLGELASRGWR